MSTIEKNAVPAGKAVKLTPTQIANRKYRAKLKAAHDVAYIVHDKLHLTFGQCVQAIVTDAPVDVVVAIANRNITKYNDKRPVGTDALSVYDANSYRTLYAEKLAWAA